MNFPLQQDTDAYCWLKLALEPNFRVESEPQSGYFAQWLYCYRIYKRQVLIKELKGDYRLLVNGSLVAECQQIAAALKAESEGMSC